jgi:phosphoglycerate kinase
LWGGFFLPDFRTLDDFSLEGKVVLLRADLNVPMQDGIVSDTARLERLAPTLKDLCAHGAKVVILSHLGRPGGKRDEAFSLQPVAACLAEIIKKSVSFAGDCCGPVAQAAVRMLGFGEILVLENTRFYPGEKDGDPAFAKELASLGDVFVNDAFSAAHRAHASTSVISQFLPCAAGRLMEEELSALSRALETPLKPVMALVGGAKISTKLDLLRNLVAKMDLLVLGGGMANTFLAAQGVAVGKSLYESDMLDLARTIMGEAQQKECKILLPSDVVVAPELKKDAPLSIVPVGSIPGDQKIFDLGPESTERVRAKIRTSRTLIWNGPLGVFEVPPFDKATIEIALTVAETTQDGTLLSVAGGGDTIAAIRQAGVTDKLSYISTAGGAFLEWLEGKTLPGVLALYKKDT